MKAGFSGYSLRALLVKLRTSRDAPYREWHGGAGVVCLTRG
jgi:hypothetical protein